MSAYAEWIRAYVAAQNNFVRGRCSEATKKMVEAFPELRRVAGFVEVMHPGGVYEEQHWWCVAPDGSVVDPTESQFLAVLSREEVYPARPHRPIPSGRCMDCGGTVFGGDTFCSEECERLTTEYTERRP